MSNNLDRQYLELLQDILDNGVKKIDRTGTGTISVFGRQIRHKMSEGFPLLTTKKMAWKSVVTELLWFLRGDTNIKYLVDNDCHIWDGDAYKNYAWKTSMDVDGQLTKEEFINQIKTHSDFAEVYGELGPIYGKQWRRWRKEIDNPETGYQDFIYVDQIQNLINDLKTNPDSRRLMVSAWNVGELDQMVLPPCHYGFQVYTRELSFDERRTLVMKGTEYPFVRSSTNWTEDEIKEGKRQLEEANIPARAISLMWNQRSVDTPLGLPFNLASYGLLLSIIAKEVNMVPDELIANLGDTHIYLNQIEGVEEQLGKDLSLEERRSMVTQQMYNMVYNGGDPSSLSHSEIDQWGIPRRLERTPFKLPTLEIEEEVKWKEGDCLPSYSVGDFTLLNYKSHPKIHFPLSN